MIYPEIEKLLTKTDNRYSLAMISAKRARQINSYFKTLSSPELPMKVKPPQVKTSSQNPLSIALEEIVQGKIVYERVIDGIK